MRSTKNFNWPWAIATALLCIFMIGVSLWYIIDKPTFGAIDCAWDSAAHKIVKCRTPRYDWWAFAGAIFLVMGAVILLMVILFFFLRRFQSLAFDIIAYLIAGIMAVVTALCGCFFCLRCICIYPVREVNGEGGICTSTCWDDKAFPHWKIFCWMWAIFASPFAIISMILVRIGSRGSYCSCKCCCPIEDEESHTNRYNLPL